MSHDRQIKEAIEQLANTHLKDRVKFVDCTVDSVDFDKGTCVATPIGGNATTPFIDVQLQSEVCDGLLLIPVVGSTITVIYSKRNAPYVYKFSDLDKIYYMGNEWQFGDGTYGGLTKTIELQTQLNLMKARLEAFILAGTTWIVVPGDGGAAFKAAAVAALTPLPIEDFSNIENSNVTHGP